MIQELACHKARLFLSSILIFDVQVQIQTGTNYAWTFSLPRGKKVKTLKKIMVSTKSCKKDSFQDTCIQHRISSIDQYQNNDWIMSPYTVYNWQGWGPGGGRGQGFKFLIIINITILGHCLNYTYVANLQATLLSLSLEIQLEK